MFSKSFSRNERFGMHREGKLKYHYDNNFACNPRIFNDLFLYQVGEMMCDDQTEMSNHVHLDWYEFTYVLSGSGTIFTNNKPTHVEKHDLYFSHPKEIHRIFSDADNPLRFFFCAFNFTSDSPFTPILDEYAAITKPENNRKFHTDDLGDHFTHLLSEIKADTDMGRSIFEYELKLAILKVIQRIKQEKIPYYRAPQTNSTQLLCFNIINYIDTHIYTLENMAELSDVFGYNYSYLSRCFKKTIGESISSYIINKKLAIAKEILSEGDVTVTEVANKLRYSSIYVFSRAFKDKYHVSPGAFKQAASEKKNDNL